LEHPAYVIWQDGRHGPRWEPNDVGPVDLPSRGGEQKK